MTLDDLSRTALGLNADVPVTAFVRELAAGVLRAVAASAHELAGDPLSDNESFKAGWREACAYLQIVLERIAAEGTQA